MAKLSAEKRAMELMYVPIKDLPPGAYDYARSLCKRYGGCMEVFITAYAHYAVVVEGLVAEDVAYDATPAARTFFADFKVLPDVVIAETLS